MTLPKIKPIYLFVAGLTILVIILFARIIWFQPIPVIKTVDNEKVMRDSIKLLMKQYHAIEQDKLRLHASFDSLQKTKAPIIKIYEKQIKNVQNAPVDSVSDFIRDALKGSN